MPTILGIDEAGRGSVIGPMIIAGVMVDEIGEEELRRMGVKDSKMLTPKKREELYPLIKGVAKDVAAISVSAREIDELRKKKNLNIIEAERMAQIIRLLKADTAYVDAPQVSTGKFRDILLNLAKNHTKIVAENYADKKYPAVSAASIIAKVERDRAVEEIKKIVGFNFGVGYSHDERSIRFVKDSLKEKKNLEWIRQSWMTVLELKGKQKQKALKEFQED
jgi:ribonuclease HII